MKILITGNEGFIGKHFTAALTDHTIVGVDIKSSVDCRDWFRANSKEKFDLVIHLAAIVGGRQTIENDPLAIATDLSIDAEMFNWALRSKPDKIVYFSSSAAYPTSLQDRGVIHNLDEMDIDLENIHNPDMVYGWTKLTGEYLAKFANEKYGLSTYIFRPFSGYGEDQDLSYPFPSFIQRGMRREDPFQIWGDGTACRDFIHVDDIVNAVLEVIQHPVTIPVNLCSGRCTSFNEFAELVAKEVGYSPAIEHLLDKPVGVHRRVGDPEFMLSYYTPRISLEEGIRRCIK